MVLSSDATIQGSVPSDPVEVDAVALPAGKTHPWALGGAAKPLEEAGVGSWIEVHGADGEDSRLGANAGLGVLSHRELEDLRRCSGISDESDEDLAVRPAEESEMRRPSQSKSARRRDPRARKRRAAGCRADGIGEWRHSVPVKVVPEYRSIR